MGVSLLIKIKVSDLMGVHKMSKKDVSEKTGIRPSTVSMYYYDTIKRMEISHINELCKLFCCQPGDLFEYIKD